MSKLKALLDSFKTETKLLGLIQRHLLTLDPWEGRAMGVIHPSELVYDDWCPRAVFYRLRGDRLEDNDPTGLHREIIFAEGHEYHRKWQSWCWDLGILSGVYRCNACGESWDDTSPSRCIYPACDAPREALEYREVPCRNEELRLGGHADGLLVLGDSTPLLEVKSIGEGTIRWYAPQLLAKHTHKIERPDGTTKNIVDMNAVWRGIRRPFGPHVKQVTIYGYCIGTTDAVIIYENKLNGQHKEFYIQLDYSLIEAELEQCRLVVDALAKDEPPPCANRKGKKNCKLCRAYEQETDNDSEPHQTEPGAEQGHQGRRARPRRTGGRGDVAAEQAEAGASHGGGGLHGGERPEPDGDVPSTDGLEQLRQRSPRAGSDQGGDRGEDPAARTRRRRGRVRRQDGDDGGS